MSSSVAGMKRVELAEAPTLRQILASVGITPFSDAAVEEYRNQMVEAAKQEHPLSALFMNNPDRLYQRRDVTDLWSILLWVPAAMVFFGACLAGGLWYNSSLMDARTMYQTAFFACVASCALCVLASFCCAVLGREYTRAAENMRALAWNRTQAFVNDNDLPQEAKHLMERLKNTGAKDLFFHVHRMGDDPLLEADYFGEGGRESAFILCWEGSPTDYYRLVEVDGKLAPEPGGGN